MFSIKVFNNAFLDSKKETQKSLVSSARKMPVSKGSSALDLNLTKI